MSATPSAAAAGNITIGGDIVVHRLGFGAMRITGKGIWGPPADPVAARATLACLPELGVNFIDTADSYGPHTSEELIREVLHPYDGLTIATKGGLTRPGPDDWRPRGAPDYLRQCVEGSLQRLALDRIPLWQLHRIDAAVPREEQFATIAAMRDEGLIAHVGLSEVGIEDIVAAQKFFPVASVQNQYDPLSRHSEDVLDYCEKHSICFIPWAPLGSGALAVSAAFLPAVAERLHATSGQIVLAWLLKRSPVMLPIPGTGRLDHLVENVAAAELSLSATDLAAFDALRKGTR